MTTLLISHPACLLHDMGEGHPEQPDRLRAVERALEAETFQMLARDAAPRADLAAIARVHPLDYIEALQAGRRRKAALTSTRTRQCRPAPSRPRCDRPAEPFSPSTR